MQFSKSFKVGHEAWWIWFIPFIAGAVVLSVLYVMGLKSSICLSVGFLVNVLLSITFVTVYVLIPSIKRIVEGLKVKKLRQTMQNRKKAQDGKVMSKEQFVEVCNKFVSEQDEKEDPFPFIGYSVYLLFKLNNIDDGQKPSIASRCAAVATDGWNVAGDIEAKLKEDDEDWDAQAFDSFATSGYLQMYATEEKVTDAKALQLIRWTYNYAASMRIKYQIIDKFREAFLNGDMYDIHIETLSVEAEDIISHISDGTLEETEAAKETMESFRDFFSNCIELLGNQRVKDFANNEPDALGFFYGGLLTSSMTQGKLDVNDLAEIDSEKEKSLRNIFNLYLQHLAGSVILDLHQKYPEEGFAIYVFGIYCNQLLENDQLMPYTMNYDTLEKAIHGDIASKVMLFNSPGI